MNTVSFNEGSPLNSRRTAPRGLIGLVLRWGLAKTPQGAERVLLFVALVALALAAGIGIWFKGDAAPKPLPPSEYLLPLTPV